LSRIAGPEGAVVKLHADAALYAGLFDGDEAASLSIAPGRKAYVHLIRGALQVNGAALSTGDAALLDNEQTIQLTHGEDAEVLVFDLAP
jgi:redox-sensitive bicupin YhaK (pirin superfamily)